MLPPRIQINEALVRALVAGLPLEIPEPLALGRPGHGYPHSWAIYRWITGETAAHSPPTDIAQFAEDLARFLSGLHEVPMGDARPRGRRTSTEADRLLCMTSSSTRQ